MTPSVQLSRASMVITVLAGPSSGRLVTTYGRDAIGGSGSGGVAPDSSANICPQPTVKKS